MVYVNGVPYVSSAEYYRQAAELARTVQPIVIQNTIEVPVAEDSTPALAPPEPQADEESEWMPMGSFAVLKADETTEDFNEEVSTVMQLATNKKGEIRGNYFMADGDTARQIVGAVDSKSQRVAMRFADDENTVMECGLWNLTQDSVPLLVHFDAEDTEQMTLIRLSDPEDEEQNGPVLPEN